MYRLVLSMNDVADLAGVASTIENPETYVDNSVKAVIYKCKALTDYQKETGDLTYTITVER